ncbi:GDSL esterase/lipase EXL3-like [Humulus lupulus]|uniref:GDSL esterase/lipase EXL3-like n=1 Tax=Humulus lupulus TaxID=3486 RepID=UPI002B40340C|nr:GDSL esterase/lipase EXL3-like [Humulus lupulus]
MMRRSRRNPSTASFLIICVDMIILWCSFTEGRVKIARNKTVSAVIMFGDSIVDTGNNNNNILSPARSNFPPYGRDFRGGKSTGRYSNGKVPSDLFADGLGIKELLPPYADPNLTPKDLLTGVCFAVGGVGYDPFTSKLANVPPLSDQLEKFKEYIEKLKGIAGEEKTKFILANSIILIVLSSNDIANTYFAAVAFRRLQYDISSYTDLMVSYATDFVKDLYGLGARRIGVMGAPPIGCVPSQRTVGGGIKRNCYDEENEAAIMFNSKLSASLDSLTKNYVSRDTRLVYVDIYYPLLDVIQNPTRYGFTISKKGCCGTGLIEAALTCNPFDTTCVDATKYVFWDAYHPTEKAYKVIVNVVISALSKTNVI